MELVYFKYTFYLQSLDSKT